MNKDLLKENRVHGSAVFPFNTYCLSHNGNEILFDCHWHDELELLLIKEGKAVIRLDTVSYEVSEGQAVFINSGVIHTGYVSGSSTCCFEAMVFHPGLLYNDMFDSLHSKYIRPLMEKRYSVPIHFKGSERWEKDILNRLYDIAKCNDEQPYAYELAIQAHLYSVFSTLLSKSLPLSPAQKSLPTPDKSLKLKQAIRYIQTNHCRRICIRELADLLNVSEGHFCRFFKQQLKQTPMNYLNYYRIHKAACLLEDPGKKILEISMEVGFDNLSYFIGIFKRYMKCTPSEYRKNQSLQGRKGQ